MGEKKYRGCVYTEWFRLEGTWGSSPLLPLLRPRCLGFWPLKPRISKDEGPTTVLNAYSRFDHHHCKEFFSLALTGTSPTITCVSPLLSLITSGKNSSPCSLWSPIRWLRMALGSPLVTSKENKLNPHSLFLHIGSVQIHTSVQIFKFCILKVLQEWAELVTRKQHGISKLRLNYI